MYGVKCPKCGLMQLSNSVCKACGAAIAAPVTRPKATPKAVPRHPAPPVEEIAQPSFSSPLEPSSPQPPPASAFQQPMAEMALELDAPLEIPLPPRIEKTFPSAKADPPEGFFDRPAEENSTRRAAQCSECGMPYFEDELVRLGDGLVCGSCKPLFVQKLREGVTLQGEMIYAGFWIRLVARIIDVVILFVGTYMLGFIIAFISAFRAGPPGANPGTSFIAGILGSVSSLVISIGYPTYFLGKFSATPGKMALGLKVVRSDGEKITYLRALGRFFAEFVSSIILCIGYIMAAFDEEKRALHDRICDTRVIRQP